MLSVGCSGSQVQSLPPEDMTTIEREIFWATYISTLRQHSVASRVQTADVLAMYEHFLTVRVLISAKFRIYPYVDIVGVASSILAAPAIFKE
ncbi:hypothetical protein AQ1_01121 [alpha proteobacterium Q-1]|nr:hypothetical protein AQ1_01121 [alpha proteobacterium Q-1]